MAVRDIQALLVQSAAQFDPALDVSSGSPFDVKVVQPLLRRLGTDPFTVDITTFITERLAQAYPDLALNEGSALVDILIKPLSILWDPIVREIQRVRQMLSAGDPSILTLDEAEALAANTFTDRRSGGYARGVSRLFVANPQTITVTPINFVTTKNGLHFFPTDTQTARTDEVALNVTSSGLYYFDINVVAEAPGAQYNIGRDELNSVAGLPAVVKVTNLNRFTSGKDAESAADLLGRVKQEIGEKSLVGLRGIAAKLLGNIPETSRLNVVGFNDPEMQRDVISGGALGDVVAAGAAGVAISDGEGKAHTRRFYSAEIIFTDVINTTTATWVLTVFDAVSATVLAKDYEVLRVVSSDSIDLVEQELYIGAGAVKLPWQSAITPIRWTLRRKELTISKLPGGILFPTTSVGTLTLAANEVHVGGSYDTYIKGQGLDSASLVLDTVTDDVPFFGGSKLATTLTGVTLGDLVLGVDYDLDSETYTKLASTALLTYSLQILDGVDAGIYRILSVTQTNGQPVAIVTYPVPSNQSSFFRWKILDLLNIDLVEPKNTKVSGTDLRLVQGTTVATTLSGVDLHALGVTKGDTLRVVGSVNAGDYTIVADPQAPNFDRVTLDRKAKTSSANLTFSIFTPNSGGGITRPLIRVTSVDLLDGSKQPLGTTVPYAKPVDVQSRAFQNPARGIKHDLSDCVLGLVSAEANDVTFLFGGVVNGLTLSFKISGVDHTITFSNVVGSSLANVISEINSLLLAATGLPELCMYVGTTRFGLRPIRGGIYLIGGTAQTILFGSTNLLSTYDIRSATVDADGGWSALSPGIDTDSGLDVVQVLDGYNIGFYANPIKLDEDWSGVYPTLGVATALQASVTNGFAPEVGKHVQVGARSIGSARVYFLEPTSFEVDSSTRFTLSTNSGDLVFLPDPTLSFQQIPALPTNTPVTDGASTAGGLTFTSASQDFLLSNIVPGDLLYIDTIPLTGSIALTDPVVGLVNKTFIFSLDDGTDRVLTFIRDDVSLATTEVSRDGVVAQINASAGEKICSITGGDKLQFETGRRLVIRHRGTANSLILGLVDGVATPPGQSFSLIDQNNVSPHYGSYTIVAVTSTTLTVSSAFPSSLPYPPALDEQTFRVMRKGVQRIATGSMAQNTAEAGLYYFDVELLSEGSGDSWNIQSGLQLIPTGYRSDGYYLSTEDSNFTFSGAEDVTLVLSRSILESGVDDDPVNATQLTGHNVQVTYEYSKTVNNTQAFLSSEVERVVCASPLGRHLIPHFVRFDLTYVGGSKEDVVRQDVEKLITDLYPIDSLDSSDIQKVVSNRGATYIANPLTLLAVVYGTDRSVWISRSQNKLSTGRLSAFIPDVINIKRALT